MKVLVIPFCPTLCDSIDCSPPNFSVRGNFQARILEWIAISFSRGDQYYDEEDNVINDIYEMINPEILTKEGENTNFEGCLSFPGRNGRITRPQKITVRAQDRNGEWFEMEAEGLLARAICHENDHLDGITVLDNADIFYEDLTEEEREKLVLDDYD